MTEINNSVLLFRIYSMVKEGLPERAIRILFSNVNYLLNDKQFDQCSDLLNEADLDKLDTNLIVGLLTICLYAKDKIKSYNDFYNRAEIKLTELAPDRVERLLVGLK